MRVIQLKAPGCIPCQNVYNFLKTNLGEDHFEQIDATEGDNKTKYELKAVPVVILYDDGGNEVKRVEGARLKELKEVISLYNEQKESA